jgi:hypothetical protein
MGPAELAARFEADGFVLVPALLPPAEVRAAVAGVEYAYRQPRDRMNESRPGGPPRWMRQRTYEWHRAHPVFAELLAHPLVVDLARRVIGADFHVIAAQCSRINPRATGAESGGLRGGPSGGHMVNAMHQDSPFFVAGEAQARGCGDADALRAVADELGAPLHRAGFSAMWCLHPPPSTLHPPAPPPSTLHPPASTTTGGGGVLLHSRPCIYRS